MNTIVQLVGPVWATRIVYGASIFADIVIASFKFGARVTDTTLHYLNGTSNTWVFLRDNIGPLPASIVKHYS